MIGIVIVNYNTYEDTLNCVKSIIETTKKDYHIYIIDNLSTDNSYEKLKNYYQGSDMISVVNAGKNAGYSAGNNIGIKLALNNGADAVLLSNSDVIYYEKAIDLMYDKLINSEEKIQIIGPQIRLENGELQDFVRKNYNMTNYIFTKKPFIYFDFFGINKRTYYKKYDYSEDLVFQGILSGCCLLIGKTYFQKSGYLDENVFLYFEESIIGINAQKNNLLTCLVVNAVVLHKVSVSVGQKNSAFSRYHRSFSSLYMFKKYLKVSKVKFSILCFINIFPYTLKSIFSKEYRSYRKKLKQEVKKISYMRYGEHYE